MSDEDRALARSITSPAFAAIPEEIDHELTPPPHEPIPPESIGGYQDLPDRMQAQLDAMHNTQREQDIAIQRFWSARKLDDEVAQLRDMLRGLNALAGVPELLRVQGYRIELLGKRDEKLEVTLEKLDKRLDEVEKAFVKIELQISSLSNRVGEVVSSLTKRIDDVEAEIERVGAKAAAEISKFEARIASLEKDRSTVKAWAILIAFLASIAAWILGKYT